MLTANAIQIVGRFFQKIESHVLSLSVFIGYHEVYLEKIYKILNLLCNFSLILFVIYTDKNIIFFALWAGILDLFVTLLSFLHAIIKYKLLSKHITKYTIAMLQIGI